jgi:hypothetical protein
MSLSLVTPSSRTDLIVVPLTRSAKTRVKPVEGNVTVNAENVADPAIAAASAPTS